MCPVLCHSWECKFLIICGCSLPIAKLSHFVAALLLQQLLSGMPALSARGAYVCQHCTAVAWSSNMQVLPAQLLFAGSLMASTDVPHWLWRGCCATA
jgi:hypothetical protein